MASLPPGMFLCRLLLTTESDKADTVRVAPPNVVNHVDPAFASGQLRSTRLCGSGCFANDLFKERPRRRTHWMVTIVHCHLSVRIWSSSQNRDADQPVMRRRLRGRKLV